MSENVREQHTILDAVSIEAWRTERHRRKQTQGRSNGSGGGAADRAHPLEFDEGGFPVSQRNASFVDRVARLLNAP